MTESEESTLKVTIRTDSAFPLATLRQELEEAKNHPASDIEDFEISEGEIE